MVSQQHTCLDGAQSNRDLMKTFIKENTSDTMDSMMFVNIFEPSKSKYALSWIILM